MGWRSNQVAMSQRGPVLTACLKCGSCRTQYNTLKQKVVLFFFHICCFNAISTTENQGDYRTERPQTPMEGRTEKFIFFMGVDINVCLYITFLVCIHYYVITTITKYVLLIIIRIKERKLVCYPFCPLFIPSLLAQC